MQYNSNIEFITNAVHRYSDMVIRIAFGYTRNIPDSEDIMQEVFLSLLSVPLFFSGESHLKAWLIRVAINKCKNHLKSAKRKQMLPLSAAEYRLTESAEKLLDQLDALPPKDRTIVYLFYYEGYTAKEIAVMTDSKEKAVLMRLSRARAKLKNILE